MQVFQVLRGGSMGYLNHLRDLVHENAVKHGFWEGDFNFGEKIALIHSEVSEALEAHRHGKTVATSTVDRLFGSGSPDDFENTFKDTVEDELADSIIRILDLCGYLGINIDIHVDAKMRYNAGREYKHGKAY
jgi:NTP pyrophosphatase (non-canonical NTP hydrolase)